MPALSSNPLRISTNTLLSASRFLRESHLHALVEPPFSLSSSSSHSLHTVPIPISSILPPPPPLPPPEFNMTVSDKPRFKPLRRCDLACTLMRAGTSKALFIHRRDLPAEVSDWKGHLVSALGSRGDDARQIDGVGGGTSTTSKVAVVAASNRPGVDVEWTFVQVAVGRESIDMTGTCGNVSSGVGPFALQSGLVKRRPGEKTVKKKKKKAPLHRVSS